MLVITGAGKGFSAGADLPALFGDLDPDVGVVRSGLHEIYDSFLRVRRLRIPTIAAVNGAAVGAGVNLAMCCDVRIAGPHARFGITFTKLGLHPGGGCTWFLTQALGRQRAMALIMDGGTLDADEAQALGLVLQVAEDPVCRGPGDRAAVVRRRPGPGGGHQAGAQHRAARQFRGHAGVRGLGAGGVDRQSAAGTGHRPFPLTRVLSRSPLTAPRIPGEGEHPPETDTGGPSCHSLFAGEGCWPPSPARWPCPPRSPRPRRGRPDPGGPTLTNTKVRGIDVDASTIPELEHYMDTGRLTSVQLVRFYLARIQRLNPYLNAVITTSRTAVSDARRGRHRPAARRPATAARHPDHGQGQRRHHGHADDGGLARPGRKHSERRLHRHPAQGRGEGLIIGKANLSEWANYRSFQSSSGWSGVGGQTHMPYVLDRNPCGSSSGSAVAAAADLATVAIGTETDGSIVCPSGTNGDVGIKPTLGAGQPERHRPRSRPSRTPRGPSPVTSPTPRSCWAP